MKQKYDIVLKRTVTQKVKIVVEIEDRPGAPLSKGDVESIVTAFIDEHEWRNVKSKSDQPPFMIEMTEKETDIGYGRRLVLTKDGEVRSIF